MTPTFLTSRPDSAADPSQPHLILVGLPGAGKTTVGQAVAGRLDRAFLDLDLEIERHEGRSIGQIFGEDGEPYFRQLERELTEKLTHVGNMIVSPGGGWVTDPANIAMVRPPSQLVYLKVTPELALKRLGPMRTMRPLLTRPDPLGELKRLLKARQAIYEGADHVVNVELLDLQRVVEKVIDLVGSGLQGLGSRV